MAEPTANDRSVGRARYSTAAAQKNPSGTRIRARRAAAISIRASFFVF
jgi:hypothetical protein